MGPRAGRGRGNCPPDGGPGAPGGRARFGLGRGGAPQGGGRGRCWGGGRRGGRRRWGQAEASLWAGPPRDRVPEEETESLRAQVSSLEQQLQQIQGRLAEQEGKPDNDDE